MASTLVDKIENSFEITTAQLKSLAEDFVAEMQEGLEKDGKMLAMIPSYVTELPTGKETGSYYAIDFGGSNLRILQVTLHGESKFSVDQNKFTISDQLKAASGDNLFDQIALFTKEFLANRGVPLSERITLGFTFSFPVLQSTINHGKLIKWTKGFVNPGVEGEDVVRLLDEAFARANMDVDVIALVNDTVGTLMAHAYQDPDTRIGVIFGTGTNAAYIERSENVKKHHGDVASDKMIMNIEWGNFKKNMPLLPYDKEMDAGTQTPGHQVYEKMISGAYLGETARLVLLDLIKNGNLFGGIVPESLSRPWMHDSQYISEIASDTSSDCIRAKMILQQVLGISQPSKQECEIVKRVGLFIGKRAARISAIALLGVLKQGGWDKGKKCTVGIDGSVFEKYPGFKQHLTSTLKEVLGDAANNIKLDLAKDGSGVGAAIIAKKMFDAKKH